MNKQQLLTQIALYCNTDEQEAQHLDMVLQKVVNELISEFRQNAYFYECEFANPTIVLPFEIAYIYSIQIDHKPVPLLKLENLKHNITGVVLLDFNRLRIHGVSEGTLELSACVFWNGEGEIPLPQVFGSAILSGCEIILRHHHISDNDMQFLQLRHKQNKDELRTFYNRATTATKSFSHNVRI